MFTVNRLLIGGAGLIIAALLAALYVVDADRDRLHTLVYGGEGGAPPGLNSELRQCRANGATLEADLGAQNAEVSALGDERDRLRAQLDLAEAQAEPRARALDDAAAVLAANPPAAPPPPPPDLDLARCARWEAADAEVGAVLNQLLEEAP